MSTVTLERHPMENNTTYETLPVEQLEDHFPELTEEFGSRAIYLVRADLNKAGTFKERGALLATSRRVEQGVRHITTASAGNHARGVLLAARQFNIPVRLFVPENAPPQKSEALYRLWTQEGGRDVDFELYAEGECFDDTLEIALESCTDGSEFIHPFDDRDVIEGQGTLLGAVMRSVPTTTDIFVPVGGGGLLAGMVDASSSQRIHGVEAIGSDSMSRTLRAASESPLQAMNPNKKYGGTAVQRVGQLPVDILRRNHYDVNLMVTAHDEGMRELARAYSERAEHITPLEPTALLAVEGLRDVLRERRRNHQLPHDAVVTVVATGHNESHENLLRPRNKRFQTISGYTTLTPPSRR